MTALDNAGLAPFLRPAYVHKRYALIKQFFQFFIGYTGEFIVLGACAQAKVEEQIECQGKFAWMAQGHKFLVKVSGIDKQPHLSS